MTHPNYPSFDVEIDHDHLQTLPIPNRISKILKGVSIVKVHRGQDPKVYSINLFYISYGHRVQTRFGSGWDRFIDENDIQLEDLLEITYQGDNYFHVVVIRGGIEIPNAIDPDVIVLSSSGDDIPSDDDDDDDDDDGPDEREGLPEFTARFTQPYINVGRLNVPLDFARSHLDSLGPETAVDVWMRSRKYPCCLYVKRDSSGEIRLCNIRSGMSNMIRVEAIKKGDRLVVQMISNSPPSFKVLFA